MSWKRKLVGGGEDFPMIKICFDGQRKRTKFIFRMGVRICCLCLARQWPSFIFHMTSSNWKFRLKKWQDVLKLLANVSNKMQIPLPKNTVNTVGDWCRDHTAVDACFNQARLTLHTCQMPRSVVAGTFYLAITHIEKFFSIRWIRFL